MKLFKNWIFWGLVISILAFISGYAFSHSYQFGICYSNIETQTFAALCRYNASIVGDKLFFPSLALAFIFLILLFVPQAVRAWRKFATWGIPVIGFLIAFSDPGDSGWGIGPSYSQYIQFFSSLYVIGSIVAILGARYTAKTGKRIAWYFSPAFVVPALFVLVPLGYIAMLFSISP